jgi:hypothetical protein
MRNSSPMPTFSSALLAAALGALAACTNSVGSTEDAGAALDAGQMLAAPGIAGVTDVGIVADPRGTHFGRDGASSCELGGKLLYTFGDTLFFATADDGATYRTNTAAYAALDAPTVLSEPLDDAGLPAQFIPNSAAETAYNLDAGNNGGDRIAVWPGKCVTMPDGSGLAFFDSLQVKNGSLTFLSFGAATVPAGSTTAARIAAPLWSAPDPDFFHAALLDHGFLYLYSCTDSVLCKVARAPVAQATSHDGYEYWTGSGWAAQLSLAHAGVPGSPAGFSVAWNDYLNAYVSFTSYGYAATVSMRQAPTPMGPWSDATVVYTFPSNVYAAGQHPALDADGGSTVYVSAFRDLGNFRGEIRMLRIGLRK